MNINEVISLFTKKYPKLLKNDEYQPPTYKCTRWLVLYGPVYDDKNFNGTFLLDVSKIFDWAFNHANKTWVSIKAEQQAKEYFPKWVQEADLNDESIIFLDKNQRDFLRQYTLKFIDDKLFKIWCPKCKKYNNSIEIKEFDNLKIGSTIFWNEEWYCINGQHLLNHEENRIEIF